jgi:hypothetical protein
MLERDRSTPRALTVGQVAWRLRIGSDKDRILGEIEAATT